MDITGKILIADSSAQNVETLSRILCGCEITAAADGVAAYAKIRETYPSVSVILLNLALSKINGFSLLSLLKEHGMTQVPVIAISQRNNLADEKRALALGAADLIQQPFDEDIVRYRVGSQVKLKTTRDEYEQQMRQTIERINNMWTSTIESLADIIEHRNLESGQHVKKTSLIVRMLVEHLNKKGTFGYCFSPENTRYVYEAASLHDVGKIGIPDNILAKSGTLSPKELNEMKNHTLLGYEIAKKVTEHIGTGYGEYCCEICLNHHERWDGCGYPAGLKGPKIPLSARIVAIADVYDALTNDRAYHNAKSHEEALEIIKADSGKQFDPFLVDCFCEISEEIKKR